RAGDPLVQLQQSEAAEQVVPVVLAAAHQGQRLGARIGDVQRHVAQVLAGPEQTAGALQQLLATQEVPCTGNGKDKLTQRAAQPVQQLAKQAEEEVAGLVEGEVDVVQNRHEIEAQHQTGGQRAGDTEAD